MAAVYVCLCVEGRHSMCVSVCACLSLCVCVCVCCVLCKCAADADSMPGPRAVFASAFQLWVGFVVLDC